MNSYLPKPFEDPEYDKNDSPWKPNKEEKRRMKLEPEPPKILTGLRRYRDTNKRKQIELTGRSRRVFILGKRS